MLLWVAVRGGQDGRRPANGVQVLHLVAADRGRPVRRLKDGKMLLLLVDGMENNR